MDEPSQTKRDRSCIRMNRIIPGGGLIGAGALVPGLIIATLFTVSANLAIVGTWIVPDDIPRVLTGLAIGVVAGSYAGAQFRLAQTLREQQRAEVARVRRETLSEAIQHLRSGDLDRAWERLESVRPLAESDLLVAYRRAQVLTARGDGAAAQRAWQRLEQLDRHHIYRAEITRHLVSGGPPAEPGTGQGDAY